MLNKKKMLAIIRFFIPTLIAIGIAFLLFRVLFGLVNVPTTSMANTIPPHSLSLMLRSRLLIGELQRGDIIVFQPTALNTDTGKAEDSTIPVVKRIVGMPGDTVEIKSGVVYINGEIYEEGWLAEEPDKQDFGPYVVPEDCYFVLGDNRNHSVDSRYWVDPYVNAENVIGKVFYTFG